MPVAGQTALVSYVQNGGCFIGHSWNTYDFDYYGKLQYMRDLILMTFNGSNYGNITISPYSPNSTHPILNGIPNSISFTAGWNIGGLRSFNVNPSTLLMQDANGNAALAVRNFGNGKVVCFHHAGNWIGTGNVFQNTDMQHIYSNIISWAGGGNYSWTGPNSFTSALQNPSVANAASGNYTVTVTSAAGCAASTTTSVIVNPVPTPSISGTLTFCSGSSTTLSTGSFNSYSWSTGETTQSISVSIAHIYSVTVTAGNGCTGTSSPVTTIVNPSPVAALSGTNVSYDGAMDGSVLVSVQGGTPSYSYSWNNGLAAVSSIMHLNAGTYSVVVTDQKQCTATGSVTLINLWSQKPSIPSIGRYGAVGFSLNGKGYIGTGYDDIDGIYYNDFWQYDPTTGSWTQLKDLGDIGDGHGGKAPRYYAAGFVANGKIYVGSGRDATHIYNDFWEYTPPDGHGGGNTWAAIPDLGAASLGGQGTSPRYAAVGFSMNNIGYVGTGYDGNTYYNDFWKYDPIIGHWSSFTTLPAAGRAYAVGFSINNIAYIGTGFDGTNLKNDFYVYNTTLSSWQPAAPFTGAARVGAVGFAIGAKGYIGTGSNGVPPYYKDIYQYNPAQNNWIRVVDFAGDARTYAVGFSIGNTGYIGTGKGSLDNDLWQLNPPIDITISDLSPSANLCPGTDLLIPYQTDNSYNPDNVFTAELSDGSGDFTTPTVLGSSVSSASGVISGSIPPDITAGSGYRIRVVSSSSVGTGSDNGYDIVVNALPNAAATSNSPVCYGSALTLSSSGGTVHYGVRNASLVIGLFAYRCSFVPTFSKLMAITQPVPKSYIFDPPCHVCPESRYSRFSTHYYQRSAATLGL